MPKDERVIFDRRPSAWLILLNAGPAVVLIVLVAAAIDLALFWLNRGVGYLWGSSAQAESWMPGTKWLVWAAILLSCTLLIWSMLDWLCRRYLLTERRAIVIFGVLHQRVSELPLSRVQNVGVFKPLLPRLLGLGHVGIASAGTDGYEIVWRAFPHPDAGATQVREAVDQTGAKH